MSATKKATALGFVGLFVLFHVTTKTDSMPGVQSLAMRDTGSLKAADTLPLESPGLEPRLGDGCLFVYLDVGANIGVHTRFLFEPDKYPNAKTAIGIYNNLFGSHRENRDFCSFGFEPNPAHKERHEKLEQVYKDMGWRYKYIQAGASDQDGNLTFWHVGHKGDTKQEEWGFSVVKQRSNSIPEVVPLIHLSRWIQHHIVERQLPRKVYGNYTQRTLQEGKVMMKIDIEGSEYTVLPSLMFSGVFCRGIDLMFGEFHPRLAQQVSRSAIDKTNAKGKLALADRDEAINFQKVLMDSAFKSVNPNDCKGDFLYKDDESYLHDGIPYPNKSTTEA